MHRKWKSVAALGMAVLLGCLMPMNTMLAAEDDTEAVQEMEADSVSDADEVSEDEVISDDNESVDDEVSAEEESVDDENAVDEANVEDENVVDEADADNEGNDGIGVMTLMEEPQAGDIEVQTAAAPVINITWNNGESSKYDLGGQIDYKYVNNKDQAFVCSASQDGQEVSLFYCLEKAANTTAKGEEQMGSLSWTEASSSSERILLSDDAKYVLYVKAVGADGQTAYARSGGVVVDTIPPAVTKLVDGGTYPEGTTFQVTDTNLESVYVNGVDVTAGWGAVYQVKANGTSTSCVIKAKDKAGNETTYSVNVSKDPAEDGVISTSGIYSLKTGTSYRLTAGTWQVNSDSTVYQGGRNFYVTAAGDYSFTKR